MNIYLNMDQSNGGRKLRHFDCFQNVAGLVDDLKEMEKKGVKLFKRIETARPRTSQ
jgi:hypothetical protein